MTSYTYKCHGCKVLKERARTKGGKQKGYQRKYTVLTSGSKGRTEVCAACYRRWSNNRKRTGKGSFGYRKNSSKASYHYCCLCSTTVDVVRWKNTDHGGVYQCKECRAYTNHTRRAEKKESVALSYEDFLQLARKPCSYCGSEPPQPLGYHGIDRVENSKGYLKENCVSSCTWRNNMKNVFSKEEFLEHCKKIVGHNKMEF